MLLYIYYAIKRGYKNMFGVTQSLEMLLLDLKGTVKVTQQFYMRFYLSYIVLYSRRE